MNHYDDHGVGDLKARIAELEAENKRLSGLVVSPHPGSQDKLMYRDRAITAEAKLARVKEWLGAYDYTSHYPPSEALAILSDTRKPLAVVDGWYAPGDEFPVHISDYGVDNELPVTVIIMPKEVE
jgi:hypothetical protein